MADTSERAWRGWLEQVFVWAGSASLHRDTQPVTGELLPGDLLVIPGSPGHVVVVVGVAAGAAQRRLLLGQGFMPAQSFHVLQGNDGPWFVVADDGSVTVPSWRAPFPAGSARRFPD